MHLHIWYKMRLVVPINCISTEYDPRHYPGKSMHLQALRPKQGASLVQLQGLLDGRGWRSAMPTSLPDTVLLCLARDFRSVEVCFGTHDSRVRDEEPSLNAALYVVMNLLIQHPEWAGDKNELQISDAGLMRALQIYQVGLEREIVTRITGISAATSQDALAEEMLRCAEE